MSNEYVYVASDKMRAELWKEREGELPATTAAALVFDVSDSAFGSPVQRVGNDGVVGNWCVGHFFFQCAACGRIVTFELGELSGG